MTLTGVSFTGDRARGGNGGSYSKQVGTFGGGGGGLGGDGTFLGGGGIGLGARGDRGNGNNVAFSPNGQRAAAGSGNQIMVFEIGNRK